MSYIAFRVLGKGTLPPGYPHRVPQRGALCLESSLLLSLKVTGKRTRLWVPQTGLYGETSPFPEPSFIYFQDSPLTF